MKVSWERKFHGCFKGVSRVFQRSFKKTFKVFQKKFHVAWHSSQLPEHKEGLKILVKKFFGEFLKIAKKI